MSESFGRQRRERGAVQQLPVAILDLLDREHVVVWHYWYITAIDDLTSDSDGTL
jgi:hypothetical protein